VLLCVAVRLKVFSSCNENGFERARCSVLQCVAEYCRVLQCIAVRHKVLMSCNDNGSEEVCFSVLQCVAACCSVLQRLYYIDLYMDPTRQFHDPYFCTNSVHCNTLQHTSTYCNTLQHTLFYIDDVHICMRVYILCLTYCMYTYTHRICCMGQQRFAVC